MKLIVNVNYNPLEFEAEDIEALKIFVINQLKNEDRQIGIGFLYERLIFVIQSIYFDIEQNAKVINIQQATTKKNPIIETPKIIKMS